MSAAKLLGGRWRLQPLRRMLAPASVPALALALGLAAAPALAQPQVGAASGRDLAAQAETPRRAPLRMDDLEPAVDVGGLARSAGRAPGASAAVVSQEESRRDGAPTMVQEESRRDGAPTMVQEESRRDGAPTRGASPARGGVMDSLDLGTTSITGNQELPKVLYIVPWKKSDLGELVGRPANTLLDEVLAPIDPEEFERHLSYYQTLHGSGQTEE